MVIFSIICLVVIVLAIQHLINWLWRNTKEVDIAPAVMLTVFSVIVTWYCIYYIILWGKNLI